MAKTSKFIDRELIAQIARASAISGLSPSAIGQRSINDAGLMDDLHEGRELRRGTRDRLAAYLATIAKPLKDAAE